MKQKLNEKEIKRLKELEDLIMYWGEIYNDKEWEYYDEFFYLINKKNG